MTEVFICEICGVNEAMNESCNNCDRYVCGDCFNTEEDCCEECSSEELIGGMHDTFGP